MKFEDYIRKIRPELDTDKTDEEYIWKGIADNLNKKKTTKNLFLKIAAGLLLFITIGLLYENHYSSRPTNNQLVFQSVDQELAEKESNLVKQIRTYQKEIKQEKFNKEKLATEFSELDRIDQLIKIYAKDLEKYGPDPRILNTLMDLYHKKIKVLGRMSNEIQKMKKYENHQVNI
jgi:hypothetical protein